MISGFILGLIVGVVVCRVFSWKTLALHFVCPNCHWKCEGSLDLKKSAGLP